MEISDPALLSPQRKADDWLVAARAAGAVFVLGGNTGMGCSTVARAVGRAFDAAILDAKDLLEAMMPSGRDEE